MILRMWLWLQQWRGAGWFQPNGSGGLPAPDAWQGWLVTALLVAALAGCTAAPKNVAPPLALIAVAIYGSIMYWTYRGD